MDSTIARVATALLIDYSSVYYIDLKTGRYECYSTNSGYQKLELHSSGEDFFRDCQRDILTLVYQEDRAMVSDALRRESLLRQLQEQDRLSIVYRLMMSDGAHYVRLMAVLIDDNSHLIIAQENIDDEIKSQQAMKDISEKNMIFSQIAESLANQYGMIYYIDTETDNYIEFTASAEYKDFNISPIGNDFFGTSQRNVSMIVHPDDREQVFEALDKKEMLKALKQNGSYTMTYRLLMSGESCYTRMTVFWANDNKHLIMGVMNIEHEIQKENAIKKTLAENATFFQIAVSLANQYDTIYYVDMLNDHYIEFSSTDTYKSLDVRPSGDDFFAEALVNIERVIHPEDRDEIHRILDKSVLIQMLQGKHMITHTYRLLIGNGVMYARLSVIWATDNKHLIIGVMNIDKEIRKEQEIEKKLSAANEKAYRDEMTGVKNKTAFTEYMENLQERIRQERIREFSIVICDVNGLKTINDSFGHIEGDSYIRSACTLICHTWQHSPVFRIGGDEFAVVLHDSDYQKRRALEQQIKEQVRANLKDGNVVVAVGMADYCDGSGNSADDVFALADSRMYADKAVLKSLG